MLETRAKTTVYLTTEEVAERYRTSSETVRYWRHVGKGPRSLKVGVRVLYSLEDLLSFEDAQKTGSAA